MEIITEDNEMRQKSESKMTEIPQKALCLDHTEFPSKAERTSFSQPEEIKSLMLETVPAAFGMDHLLHGCEKDTIYTKDTMEISEKSLVQKVEMDLLNYSADKNINSNLEVSDLVDRNEHDKLEFKVKESCDMKNHESPEGKVDDDSADKESDVTCKGEYLLNDKLISSEETNTVLSKQNDNLNGDLHRCSRSEEFQDDCLREGGLDKKESCSFTTKVDKDLRDQTLPEISDSPVKEDFASECVHHEQVHGQPLADIANDGCNLKAPLSDESPVLNSCYTLSEVISNDSVVEENLTNEKNCQKQVLPNSDENTCLFEDSFTALGIPKAKENVEMENKTDGSNFKGHLSIDDLKEHEIKPTERDENTGKIAQQEPFQLKFPSPKCDLCEPDKSFMEKMDSEENETDKESDQSLNETVIPILEEAMLEVCVAQPQDKTEKVIPFISESTDPVDELPSASDVCSTSQACEKAELFSLKTSLLDVSEAHTPEVFKCMFDSRPPTPTIDEKPYENISPSSGALAYRGNEICPNNTPKCPTPVTDELLSIQKSKTSAANAGPKPVHGDSDVSLRTLRVLKSIDRYLSTRHDTGMPSHLETTDIKPYLDPPNKSCKKSTSTCLEPSNTTVDVVDQRTSNEKPPEVSSFSSQDPYSSNDIHISPFKTKSQKVRGVKLQLKKKNSSVPQCRPKRFKREQTPVESDRTYTSAEGLRDKHKITLQSVLNHGCCSHTVNLVKAKKLFKRDKSWVHQLSKEGDVKTTSKNKQAYAYVVKKSSSTSVHLKKTRETSDGLNNNHNVHERFSNRLAHASYSKWNTDEDNTVLGPQEPYKGRSNSEFKTSSPPSVQSFKSTGCYPDFVDEHQWFWKYSSNEYPTEYPTKQMSQKDLEKPFTNPNDDCFHEDNHIQGAQSSLLCTVFNTEQKNAYSVLEQLSQRCLTDDLTQASMEQECLIFSNQMKNLLKKSESGPICQKDLCDSLPQSSTKSLIVNFSSLEEQEDSHEFLDMPLVGQKIMVDMSDRKDLTDRRKEENISCSQGTSDPMEQEHAGVSDVIAECARVYKTKMYDVCSVKKALFKAKRTHRGYLRTEPSSHFDFCGQMKKELDETFRSNLNAVVKKSCKTKYRFYILVTSDSVFFENTKTHMEAEGHTAVQPSEFFLNEDSSSCLIIIIRNEDIAEHICEIPHFLKLKTSPGVQFAGIDEPDDVVNFTHQELFIRAGFIMFDKALLEPLSLCNMKKISKVLQELSRLGKWKWMLHYRDSRRLKENARLSDEANEKKLFLYWGQDTGILDVLPYHECDSVLKDQPDYLTCLLRLQVQHISSRYPVFVTDAATNGAFEENGILTMTLNTFLTKSFTELFPV